MTLALVLAVWCCTVDELCIDSPAQQLGRVPRISSETYNRVLELVFPRGNDFKDHKKEFILTLRYMPSFEAGSQVRITKYSDGSLEVVTYNLAKRNQSIGEQLNDIFRETGREDPEEMAKRLSVQTQTITDTGKIRILIRRLSSIRFPPHLDSSIAIDATGYHLWYDTVSNRSYYSLAGNSPDQDRFDHPLVRWMNEVRRALSR